MRISSRLDRRPPTKKFFIKFLEWLQWVAIAAWVGGMVFVSFIGAPVAFNVLGDDHLAGSVVGRMLNQFYLLSYGSGVLLLLIAIVRGVLGQLSKIRFGLLVAIVLLLLGVTLYSRESVSSRMQFLRESMGRVQDAQEQDPRRMAFDHLHRRSVQLMVGSIIGGLILILIALGPSSEPSEIRRWRM